MGPSDLPPRVGGGATGDEAQLTSHPLERFHPIPPVFPVVQHPHPPRQPQQAHRVGQRQLRGGEVEAALPPPLPPLVPERVKLKFSVKVSGLSV